MRFLHVSDLHIGKSFYHQDPREFLDLQEDLLRKVIQKAQDLQCDALVIAGDIYDRQDPGAEAVAVPLHEPVEGQRTDGAHDRRQP
ncbi:metallophosphoesterase family protein [Faecalibaculum rodentium]|uniref:metallophosphoesterase family protein n=1 Tax=Faecalibaculum rodentium TaxID=1702221 RepID=UPI0025A9A7D4|nr:metallophosphoesterase [Faecalibaculum rodentium]